MRIEVAGDRPRDAPSLDDLVVGAGFETVETAELTLDARRALSLPDTVRPRMRVMVCGLNPAVYAAERGVGFARKANRFWPAAVASGLVAPDAAWDARRALLDHGVGMTDLCKRATVASSEVARHEYVAGAARVERLVRWLRPRVIAFVGLEGWRAAINPNATAGLQPHAFGGRPAYVLPSTSGLNAHARLADFTAHLRVVIAIADGAGVGVPPPVHRGRPRPTYTR